ncbi:MAG: alpha/beta hydrolase [Opitutaceae bacterium]|jgi:acetyl esterase/lipase|nr:alpha/beta hydrolase [Opitutaceae bacterium]
MSSPRLRIARLLSGFLVVALLPCLPCAGAANSDNPDSLRVYKTAGDLQLFLHLFEPVPAIDGERPCVVLIHSGGWVGNSPKSYYRIARSLRDMGIVVACLQYRLAKPPVTVRDAVDDTHDAMRYLRTHAAELRIDPARIVACGGSAGGHLAAGLALFPDATNAPVPPPAALILFNPVIDTSPAGYGNKKLGANWRELSPLHQVRPGVPPALLFHGTADRTTPFAGAAAFHRAMLENGNECEFHPHEGGDHGYYRKQPLYDETMEIIRRFCVERGLLSIPHSEIRTPALRIPPNELLDLD